MKYRIVVFLLLIFQIFSARAEVWKMLILEREIIADGHVFGDVGQYEKIRGKIYYQIDPANPANSRIVDLEYAPVNSMGMVEFSGDFLLIIPVDMTKANGRLLYDVNNRGNLYMLRNINDAMGSNNPSDPEHFGNGFLMRQGYSLLWSGWNWDVVEAGDLLQFEVPYAKTDSQVISQKTIAEMVNSNSLDTMHVMPLAWGNSRCYPSVNYPDNSDDILTVRDSPEGERIIIQNDKWTYSSMKDGRLSPDSLSLHLENGFPPGKIFELIYTVENPKIVGLGLAAVRDVLSFFKYEYEDSFGNVNPLLVEADQTKKPAIDYSYIFGVSQSGRFIAHMLYQGFHMDEKERMVFDGARIHVAGGGKGGFNFRFAQTTHHPSDLEGNYMPADHPPFNYLASDDPESGGENDLLAVAKESGKIPKIIITNHALEYWTRSASLIHTSLDGKNDASVHKDVRIFMVNGAPHGTPWRREKQIAEHSLSTLDIAPILRSTLVMLDEWVSEGVKPAESRYPRLDNGTLITAAEHKIQMPSIPGLRHPGRNLQPPICDYGPDFWDKGIMTNIPPVVCGHYQTFVPAVDKDGNGLGGIRLPEFSVPLGSYQGFNPRKKEANASDYLTRFDGSFWAFTISKKEREMLGDPRLSLEERYGSKEEFLKKVIFETKKLLKERLLIKEDADRIIDSYRALSWPPVQMETWPFWK